jgi:hypothetical protein
MKIGCALLLLVLGAGWGFLIWLAVYDWYYCEWGWRDCGPEDGWFALIFGLPIFLCGIVIVPAFVWALAVLISPLLRRLWPGR